jgi:DNA-damage-inducible protein J
LQERVIMANETIQTRVSGELKHEAENLFAGMGLGLSDAIRMFLQQSINEGGIPFQPRAKRPNIETIAAMEELNRGEGEVFDNPDDLFVSWRKL